MNTNNHLIDTAQEENSENHEVLVFSPVDSGLERYEKLVTRFREKILDEICVNNPDIENIEEGDSLANRGSYFVFKERYRYDTPIDDLCRIRGEKDDSDLGSGENDQNFLLHNETDEQYIARQSRLFEKHKKEYLEKYEGQYVLFHDGKVLASGKDRIAIALDAYESGGVRPLFIKKMVD